jgi:tubulin polyglutamylase TTLL11
LWRKKVLWSIISRMKRYFPEEYSFVPKEFLYPEEKTDLNEFLKNNKDCWMIAKPSRGCGGEGIFLFKNKFNAPILNKEFVIQKYLSKPLLIENKKFDLRLYVLIKSLEPLEAYFWNEGLVRFCTEDYLEPTDENIEKLYMHLTNFSLNKESEKYINPLEYGEENRGTKRLLSQFFEQLRSEKGINTEYVKQQIVTTIQKTIVSLIPNLKVFGK